MKTLDEKFFLPFPYKASSKLFQHTCEPVASKMLEKLTGELAKKRENFVGLRYVKNVGK